MWCDSHCHLQFDSVPEGWLERAEAAGVTRMVCIGTDSALSAAAIDVARSHPDRVWATVGLHPHDAKNGVDSIVGLLDNPEVVAVGECGLDYHYDHSPRPAQREAFEAQIELAKAGNVALVIHTREAWDDTFDILRSTGGVDRTVFHCFTGGPDEARRALDLGAYLSFSGIVTFKKADDLRGAAAMCAVDRLLVETDAPYLAPVPHRGRQNEPAFVPLVGAAIAATRGVPVEVIERHTWANAAAVFGFDHSE